MRLRATTSATTSPRSTPSSSPPSPPTTGPISALADDTTFDAEKPSSWAERPSSRPTASPGCAPTRPPARLVPSRGIWLRGASIEGKIDLYRSDVPFSLTIYDCLLDDGLNIEHAKLQELDIRNSCSAAIMATGVEVLENVYLNDTCVFGGLDFIDAQIAGDFDFTGGLASFGMPADDRDQAGVAINFHDAKIGGDIRLGDKFRACGQVRLFGAQIGRSLVCTDGEFSGAGETAIDAQRCQFGAQRSVGRQRSRPRAASTCAARGSAATSIATAAASSPPTSTRSTPTWSTSAARSTWATAFTPRAKCG